MGTKINPLWDVKNRKWVLPEKVTGPIVKSNSPQAIASSSKPTDSGQDVAREMATQDSKEKGDDTDWMSLLTAGGGGLLAYELAHMLTDKTDEEKRKESIWSKLLRNTVNIGALAAGAYGGYRLGKKADDSTQDGSVYTDLFGEKNDAASAYKWPWFGISAGSAIGGIQSARYGARRTGEWLRGGAPKEIVGKDGVTAMQLPENSPRIRAQRDNISKIESGLADDAANAKSHEEALRRIADENAQGRASHVADMKAKRIAHDANMQNFYREQTAYNRLLKAWESSGRKGKPPKPPTMPKVPTFKEFVPINPPTPTPVSGYTQANLNEARAGLKRSLGRRALGGWLGSIPLFLTSYLTGKHGWDNLKEEARVDDELRAAGIDPSTVK